VGPFASSSCNPASRQRLPSPRRGDFSPRLIQ
jgi:hypothetical protein